MDPKYYCDRVQSELTGLKARAYDIVRQMEKSPEKEKLSNEFQEIHALMDDITVSIDHLRTECPTEWSSQREEIEKKKSNVAEKINWWDEEHVPGGYVGG